MTAPKPLEMERVIDAPRALVWEAWTTAEHVSKWFTPRPLTTSECQLEFRMGGVFRVVMRMPDGAEHPSDGRFTEIVPMERIAFESTLADGNEIKTLVTFADEGGKTRLRVRQTYSFESFATRGAQAGWTATLAQLVEQVTR